MPKVGISKVGIAISLLFILGLFALCWYWGFEICALGLADPDSCWLIAVGRWIVGHKALPVSDPFSWTLLSVDRPYLPYQWLSSLIFFALFKNFGPAVLLFFDSTIVALSFLIMPLLLRCSLRANLMPQLIFSILAVSAGSFHFPLRPELFSYLFLGLLSFCLFALVGLLPFKKGQLSQLPSPSLLLSFIAGLVLFVFWANVHSGFALGFALLVVLLLAAVLYEGLLMLAKKKGGGGSYIKLILVFLCGGVAGSFCTPFQMKLYSYLPGLFFASTNKYNQELLPLTRREYFSGDYMPYTAMQFIYLLSLLPFVLFILKELRRRSQEVGGELSGDKVTEPGCPPLAHLLVGYAFVTGIMFYVGNGCRRMIPFAVLISFGYFIAFNKSGALKSFFEPMQNAALISNVLQLARSVQNTFDQIFLKPLWLSVLIGLSLIFVWWGSGCSVSIFPLTVPQTTFGFDAPFNAVGYLKNNRPPGNILNDPQFGDVMILNMDEKARVFIDTRFDLYGAELCHDYFVMANCLKGYEDLLQKYKIATIFFPHRAPILEKLKNDPAWRIIYQDNAAIILGRK